MMLVTSTTLCWWLYDGDNLKCWWLFESHESVINMSSFHWHKLSPTSVTNIRHQHQCHLTEWDRLIQGTYNPLWFSLDRFFVWAIKVSCTQKSCSLQAVCKQYASSLKKRYHSWTFHRFVIFRNTTVFSMITIWT